MFQGLQENQLRGAIEAMLFVTDEPVGVIDLADMLEVDPAEVESALIDLRKSLEHDNRGIQLREVAGGWRLYTHPAYHELVEKYVLSWDTRKLSQAAMETLAIIAYLQPTTRAGVSSVRGVNSDSSINSLVEKGLVREAGQADAPGNPTLYATTRAFLEKFGLRSTKDLPSLDDFAPDEATRRLIQERLSASTEDVRIAPNAKVAAYEEDDDAFAGLAFDYDDEGASAMTGGTVAPSGLTMGRGAATPGGSATERGSAPVLAASDSADESAGAFANEPEDALAGDAALAPANTPASIEADAPASDAAQQLLAQAMGSSFGLVDKIDFDSLHFETDDE